MQVSLIEHIGHMQRAGITVKVPLSQYVVQVQSPERIAANQPPLEYGYVHFNPGSPINPLPTVDGFPPEWHLLVAAEVNRQLIERGKSGGRTVSGIFGAWPEVESDDDSDEDIDDGTDPIYELEEADE